MMRPASARSSRRCSSVPPSGCRRRSPVSTTTARSRWSSASSTAQRPSRSSTTRLSATSGPMRSGRSATGATSMDGSRAGPAGCSSTIAGWTRMRRPLVSLRPCRRAPAPNTRSATSTASWPARGCCSSMIGACSGSSTTGWRPRVTTASRQPCRTCAARSRGSRPRSAGRCATRPGRERRPSHRHPAAVRIRRRSPGPTTDLDVLDALLGLGDDP